MPKANPYGVPGLSEEPSGSGRYVLTLYDRRRQPARKKVPLTARGNLARAIAEAQRKRDDFDAGRWDPWIEQDDLALDLAVRRYLKDHRHQRPNTLTNKRSVLKQFQRAAHARTLHRVGEEDVRRFIEQPTLREGSRRARLNVVSNFLNWAEEEGLVSTNPALLVRKKRTRRRSASERIAHSTSSRDFLLPERLAAVLAHVPSETHRLAYTFAAATGLRLGEVVHLNRRDVALRAHGGAVHVRAWVFGDEAFQPKYGRERMVPLTPRAVEAITALLQRGAHYRPDDPYGPAVVLEPAGGAPRRMTRNSLARAFRQARNAEGLGRETTFHSLRHTCLTLLALLELSPYFLCDFAGHEMKAHQRYVHTKTDLVIGHGRTMLIRALRFFCPDVATGRIEAEINAAYDDRGHTFSGPRIHAILFEGALSRGA